MRGTTADWDRYGRWNDAVADVVFHPSNAGQPVYLDLEEDVLGAIRDVAEPEATSAEVGLVRAVQRVLPVDSGPAAILRPFLQRLDRWERGDPELPPPTLGLLSVMSLAAENMRDGDGKAAHNFYGRLAELLGLDDGQRDHFISAYRSVRRDHAVSETLWGSLNLWLELHEGNRGLVTVFADRHAHVSLPMSQALVRQVDREKFKSMFALYGLAPGSTVPVVELAEIITDWMSQVPCPASNQLERLWRRDADARDRISDVARLSLESWDGSGTSASGPANGREGRHLDQVRLRVALRTFPHKRLDLNLVIPARPSTDMETIDLLDHDEEVLAQVDLVPFTSGWAWLADPEEIDAGSFLCGETRMRRGDSSLALRRRPRRVVPLRFDPMSSGYLECERINLADDFMLLVHEDMRERVANVLRAVARPGYQRHDDLRGVPNGWVLFEGVQVLSAAPRELVQHLDLNPLQPLASRQAVLQGGLVLPGNIKKWSSFAPPELRVSADLGTRIAVTIRSVRALTTPAPLPISEAVHGPVLLWDLAEEHLPDGDYDILVEADGTPMTRPLRLRLRSADNPAVVDRSQTSSLGHDPGSPGFGLMTSPRGFQIVPGDGAPLSADGAETSWTPAWIAERAEPSPSRERGPSIALPGPASGSCMLTGAHLMKIDTVYPGKAPQKLIDGVCTHCGITKRYPTRGRRKRTTKARPAQMPTFDPRVLPPVRSNDIEVDWQLLLDSVSHVMEGPLSALERVAAFGDPSALFADVAARRLEALGHIEVQRDPLTLRSKAWRISPPALTQLASGRWALVGYRSESLVAAIEDFAYAASMDFDSEEVAGGPPLLSVDAQDDDALEELAATIQETSGLQPCLLPSAADALAAVLPALSDVVAALPKISVASARSVERWDPRTARFVPAGGATTAGAFRLSGFGRTYLYRRTEDLGSMSASMGDVRIVKYAAALDSGLPLIGYDHPSEVLYVPLGADLPGLYGRAAVLASGKPPIEDERQRILRYPGVPAPLACRIRDRLSA